MYDTSFRVVQLKYSLLLSFKQSVPNLVVGVQNCLFEDHTVYDVCNVHDKFQGCTVDVKADTGFLTSVPYLVIVVKTSCLEYYTSCIVDNVHKKFQGCTVDVQAATVF